MFGRRNEDRTMKSAVVGCRVTGSAMAVALSPFGYLINGRLNLAIRVFLLNQSDLIDRHQPVAMEAAEFASGGRRRRPIRQFFFAADPADSGADNNHYALAGLRLPGDI